MGRFDDRLTHPMHGGSKVARMLAGRLLVMSSTARQRRRDRRIVPIVGDGALPRAKPTEISITWVGHASFIIRFLGRTILTDPVWSTRIPGGMKRTVAPGIHWDEVPEVDAVLISHNHYDHMDWPTLKRLPRSTPLFVPLGMEAWAKKRGFTEVHAPDWWQSTPHRGLELTFVPSHHWSRRGLADTNDSLWGGWLIAGGGRTIHFAGDTAYGPHFADIARRFPRIDATLMPIGGYEPRWFMRPVHMDPEDAVQGALDLRAQRLVTMHHATFPLTTEPILEPIERARTAWQRTGLARQRLWDLAVGETRSFA